MSKQHLVRIVTHDTKKTYEFPSKEKKPQIWEVTLHLKCVDNSTGNVPSSHGTYPSATVYLERSSLEAAGLMSVPRPTHDAIPEPQRRAEDLIMELLELVGVYPSE
jgi:hypothetical protein